jgi:hypothetical protein
MNKLLCLFLCEIIFQIFKLDYIISWANKQGLSRRDIDGFAASDLSALGTLVSWQNKGGKLLRSLNQDWKRWYDNEPVAFQATVR